jgi:hypothetical protein
MTAELSRLDWWYARGPAQRMRVVLPSQGLPMSLSRHFDRIAIALSAVCILHCLAIPLIVALLPIAVFGLGGEGHFHGLMLWLVVPVSAVGFTLGYRVHRRADIVATGASAALLLAFAGIWGHDLWPTAVEAFVSVVASLILAGAHWLNFREVRRLHRH